MILAIVKQQLRQIRNISRFRFAIAGLLSIITKYKNNFKEQSPQRVYGQDRSLR